MTNYSKALEHELEPFEYKTEKHVKVTIISVTEHQTKLRILYKEDFLIPFLISDLYKMKALDMFLLCSERRYKAESNILISIL